MSGTRVHLRLAQELKPGASVEALRRIFLLPDDVTAVGDVNRAIAAQFQLQGAFVLTLKGSRFHEADPAAAIRDGDVLHLVAVAAIPSPRAARAACECGASASCQFSNRQWGFLCKGRAARCQQCAARAQALRCGRSLAEEQSTDSVGCDQREPQTLPTLETVDRRGTQGSVLLSSDGPADSKPEDLCWASVSPHREFSGGGGVRTKRCPASNPAIPKHPTIKGGCGKTE
jgi:hypothetical protein